MRRHFVVKLAFLAAYLLGSVSGCSRPTNPGSSSPTSVPVQQESEEPSESTTEPETLATIRFGCFDFLSSEFERLAATFHELNPDVEVEIIPFREIASSDATFHPNDIVTMRDIVTQVDVAYWSVRPVATQAGFVLDLAPLIASDTTLRIEDLHPSILDLFTWEGSTWAIAPYTELYVIFYDRDLWDAAGVAYPTIDWTREDFLHAAQQLTILSEGTTTQWGYVDTLSIERLPFLESATAEELGGPTLPNLDAPQMVDALRWYTDLALVHKVMPQSPITPTAEYAKLVADIRGSNAAMWVAPLGDLPFYRESQGRQIGLATLPLSGNSRGLLHTPAHRAYFISNATPHPQESWRWLKFLSQQPLGSSSPGMFVNAIPVRHSVAESTGFWRRWNNDDREVIERALKEADTGVHAEQLAALQEAILAVWQGRPATEAAAAAQAAAMTAYASRPETSAASGAPYQPEDNAPEERTHLLFAPESLGDDFFYRDLSASFNANQNAIQVDVVTSEKLGRADCFIGPSDRILDTGSRDVLNLAPLLDAQSTLDLADFAFVESFRKQGDLYGLPAYAPATIVRYDPAAFDRHDLAYPAPGWSLDEFLTTARILSQGEGPSRRYGFVSVLGETTTLPIFIAAQGADLWDTAGRPRFAAPDVVEAVRWYVELSHNHEIMPVLPGEPGASSAEDADQRRALVADGRAAMWMTLVGLGHPATQTTAGGKEAGMAPVPGTQRTLFLPHGFFIAADSPHAAACWDWCVYAATHPAHPDLGVPAYKPALLSEAFVAQITPDVVATYRALLNYDNLSQPPGAGPQYQALLEALAEIYEGADPQTALEEAQRAASRP